VGHLSVPEVGAPPLTEPAEAVRERVLARLETIGRVVVVMSGKGGVGKSAVAVNLAAALAERGERVGLLDADLHGPSVAKMLGLRGQPIRVGAGDALEPVPGPLGLRVQSMDFFLQGNAPLDWDGEAGEGAPLRSAMEEAALADLLGYTDWGRLDLLVVDLAPGSDRLPALARWLPPGLGALAVTIPTEVSLLAVERSLRRAWAARIPLIGLVENFAAGRCASCGAEAPLYREASTERLARDLATPLLARVPFDPALAACADAGRIFAAGEGRATPAGQAIAALAERVAAWEPPPPDGESW
jgi:ATP-binding protein involved in chromosome partitioning